MIALTGLLLLFQVEPFRIESKKITPEVRKHIEKLDSIRVEAFEEARKQVAAKLPAEYQVVLEAVDGADPDPAKFARHSGNSAETSTKAPGIVTIRFYVEYFVNGFLADPESTLRHEMVHAAMRLDFGKENYGKVPKWFREGIAVFIARQMPDKFQHHLMRPEVAKDPETMLDGLDDRDHTLDDYWEDAMAFAVIGESGRPRGLLDLISRLRNGEDFKDAIGPATGFTYDEFVKASRERALKSLRALTAQSMEMRQMYAEIARLNEESGPLCEEFLKKWPNVPLRSAVLYYRAKAAKDEGIPLFDEFIASARKPGGKVDFIDDALLRRARLLVKKKKPADAAKVYADLVTWHVGSSVAVTALYEWGLLIHPTSKDRATALLKRALAVDPKHRLADRARKLVD